MAKCILDFKDQGINRMAYAILILAAEDYKALVDAKCATKGVLTSPWPKKRNSKGVMEPVKVRGHYDKAHKALDLLYFWTEGAAEEMLSLLGSDSDISAMREKLLAY